MSVGVLDKKNSCCWQCIAHCGVFQQSHITENSFADSLMCLSVFFFFFLLYDVLVCSKD